MSGPGVAFFDLDRTLIAANSATAWFKRELRLGFISRGQALRAAGWIALYQSGFGRIESALELAIKGLEGQEEAEIRARSEALWREEVLATARPGAFEALERHRAQGDRLVLLTSSSIYLSTLAQRDFGLDEILCNRFEVVDGRFTGRPSGPLCYGPGKLPYAERYATSLGLSLAQCAFYTDSYTDLPVLEAVGQPVVVHPDRRLAATARRRGWKLEQWSEPLRRPPSTGPVMP